MFGLKQFVKYISTPIALRYGIFGSSNFSFFSLGQNKSFSLQINKQPQGK